MRRPRPHLLFPFALLAVSAGACRCEEAPAGEDAGPDASDDALPDARLPDARTDAGSNARADARVRRICTYVSPTAEWAPHSVTLRSWSLTCLMISGTSGG